MAVINRGVRSRLVAVLFALLGAGLLAWLILRSNPARLGSALARGAEFVPVLLALEGARLCVEAWGARKLYERRIPFPWLLRATLIAYSVEVLAPGGRAVGEGVKAGILREHTHLSDTAAAATTMEVCSLSSLAVWSLACAAVAVRVNVPLAGIFALQSAAALAAALFFRGAVRTTALPRLLRRLSARRAAAALDSVGQRAGGHALREPLLAFISSRGLELIQYAVIYFAVTRRLAAVPALLTFGVAIVAGTLGESVPAQLGIGAVSFSAAAGALRISPEDAVAFELLVHGFQFTWVAIGLVTSLVWRAPSAPARGGA